MNTFTEKLKKLWAEQRAAVLRGVGLGAGVVILVIVLLWSSQRRGPAPLTARLAPRGALATLLPDSFFVAYQEPRRRLAGPLSPLRFTFSQPVEAEHLEEFWELRPAVPGKFEPGARPTEIKFIPTAPFAEGVTYSLTIKSGFYSTLGKKLTADYAAKLTLGYDDVTLQLAKDGDASYFFGVNDEKTLTFEVGNWSGQASAKIFSVADPEALLRSFTGDFPNSVNQLTIAVPPEALIAAGEMSGIKTGDSLRLPARPGIYLVQISNGQGGRRWSWVVKSAIGVHFRQDDQGFFLGFQDLATGAPLNQLTAQVDIYGGLGWRDENSLPVKLQTVTVRNLEFVPRPYPEPISALAVRIKGEVVIIPVRMRGSRAEIGVERNLEKQAQVFVYQDRPLYRPGDTLRFRGLIRQDNDGLYDLFPAGKEVRLRFEDETMVLTAGKRGEFYGGWQIPKNANPGVQAVSVRVDEGTAEERYGSFTYEVADYRKPAFDLTVAAPASEYVRGDDVTLSLGGYRFDGQPFANETVTLRVYALDYYETEKAVYSTAFRLNDWGGMCGGGFDEDYYGEPIREEEIKLGPDGKATFTFDTETLTNKYSQNLTFVLEKNDHQGNTITTARSVIVHAGELNIFIRRPPAATVTGLPPKIFFSAEYPDGRRAAREPFEYSLEAIRAYYRDETVITLGQGTVVTGADGRGEIDLPDKIELPEGYGRFRISVAKTDARGNRVRGELTVYDSRERETVLKVTSAKNNLKPGETAEMLIVAPAEMTVLLAYERGRLYDPAFVKLKKGENRLRFVVQEEYVPSITPTFSFFYQGHYQVEGLSFNVPAMHKLITVDLQSDQLQYTSGNQAKLKIRLTNSRGLPVKGEFSLGVVDKAVYALRKGSIPPLHSRFYYFRGRSTNNASSMTYITNGYGGAERGGGGGGGTALGTRDSDLLYWNPFMETDANGEATVEFPVSGNTIYQAVIFAATDQTELGQGEFDLTVRK
ncbi:MAG: hypothetical protein HYV42_04140 [Candidatus Magasanikbacteria bacterium]|nr:hypothetical protein [Candidatus Magasanikbacteria bacterium]